MPYHSRFWLRLLCSVAVVQLTLGHSIDNKRLTRIEPLQDLKLDIAPRLDHFYQKRQLTRNQAHEPSARSVEHDDMLRLTIEAYNQTFYLHLEPNTDLFHHNAMTVYGNGKTEPLLPESFRVYRGYAIHSQYSDERWKADQTGIKRDHFSAQHDIGVLGWARLVVRHDIKHSLDYPIVEGTFRADGDMYHIKATSNYKLAKRSDDAELASEENVHMVVYRDSDTVVTHRRSLAKSSCGFDHLDHNQEIYRQSKTNQLLDHTITPRNKNFLNGLNDPFGLSYESYNPPLAKRAATGCPATKKVNYMGVAADCSYTKYYETTEKARTQIINDWNSASAVYESSFNIALGIINITIMNEVCPTTPATNTLWNQGCSDAYTINNRLSDFSQWRGTMSEDGAGLWHLMTQCASGVEVGVAWLSQLCNTESNTQTQSGVKQHVSGTGVSSIIRDEWKVVAHEIGHGFGAIHDCTSDNCPCSGSSCSCCPLSDTQCNAGGTYIMNPTSNVSSNAFSPCSINTICSGFPNLGTCLQEPNSKTTQTLQMCGNGLVEDGEECDSGGEDSDCCDAKTCKFKAGAICDDYNDLCCDKCQFRPSSYSCRPSSSECDIAEYCTGNSSTCPTDLYSDNGLSCGTGLQCASGQCTSRDVQCKSRGSSLNVTSSCSTARSECQLYCNNPDGLGCIVFNGQFLDGTTCGSGGYCKNGSCDFGSTGDKALSWLRDHKNIAIPVGVVLGILLLSCLSRILCVSCRRRRTRKYNKSAMDATQTAFSPNPQPPRRYGSPQSGYPLTPVDNWVNPAAYNGPHPPYAPPNYDISSPPPPPFPTHTSPPYTRSPN
ncbi:Metallo-peptidase family M12-domain-containing protein [Phycomyces nitens]|nr:Metallo-peptidase family M12-domain-containing protein [Phycomyces nitens]